MFANKLVFGVYRKGLWFLISTSAILLMCVTPSSCAPSRVLRRALDPVPMAAEIIAKPDTGVAGRRRRQAPLEATEVPTAPGTPEVEAAKRGIEARVQAVRTPSAAERGANRVARVLAAPLVPGSEVAGFDNRVAPGRAGSAVTELVQVAEAVPRLARVQGRLLSAVHETVDAVTEGRAIAAAGARTTVEQEGPQGDR